MKKWPKIIGVISLCTLGSGVLLYQTHHADGAVSAVKTDQATNTQSVRIIQPTGQKMDSGYNFNVRLEPFEEAMIYSRANGYVEDWLVDIGTHVEKGEILARLSLPELEEQINQIKAEINSQEAEIVLAKTLKDRVRSLLKSGSVSKTEDDQRQADYKVAIAKREALKARLGQLEKEFSYTTIEAPFSGIITVRNLNRGDRITVNDTKPLYRIINAEKLRAVVNIPQAQLANIDLNQPSSLAFAEHPGKNYNASFWKRSGEVDLTSGTMRIEYIIENTEYDLASGLSGRLTIAPTSTAQNTWLPVNTIKITNGEAYVLAADDKNAVKKLVVVAGRYTGDKVEILSGLSGEEKVIINPNALLRPGDTVSISN